jgi:rubredoxin
MNENKICELCGHVFTPGEGRYALPDKIICTACHSGQDLDETQKFFNVRPGDPIPGRFGIRWALFSLAESGRDIYFRNHRHYGDS